MRSDGLPAALERMLRLWNGESLDPAGIYAPTCAYNGTSSFTPDEIVGDIARLRASLGELRFSVDAWTGADHWHLLRLSAAGIHHGDLVTPLGTAPPSGLRLQLRGLEAFEVVDDRIVAVWLTWDWSEAYAKLGAALSGDSGA